LLALGMFLPIMTLDACSIGYTFALKSVVGAPSTRFVSVDTASMRMLLLDKSASDAAVHVNDGIALLKKADSKPGAVATLRWDNPFPFALQGPEPVGFMSTISYGRQVSDLYHPSPERMFGGAQYVLKPKHATPSPGQDWLLKTYEPYVLANFQLAG